MPLSLPNITCPLTHFLNKILRLRADMEQIGRTSKSEDFTSIFAPICGHGAPSLRAGPYSFPCPPQRRNMYGPQHGDNAGEDSRLWRARSLGTPRQDPRGLDALEDWARARQEPPPSFGFSKNLASQAGLTRLNIRKGLVCRHTRDPRKENLSLKSFQSGVDTRRERGFLSVRPTSSPCAQRIP